MEADRKVTVGQMLLNFADVTLLENLSIPSMSEESDEDSGTVTWTYTLNAYYTGAFLGEDGHLIKEAVPSADADADTDTDTDSMEGEEQTNE
jgi:type IV pilus assembly protein PilN